MSYELVTLTAGHNAKVVGAGANGYKEHEQARLLVAQLEKDFKAVGQKVAICTDEKGTTKASVWGNAVKNCNKYDKKGRLDVSLHLNAGGGTGVEVLYYSEKSLAAKVSKAISDATGLRDRGPKIAKEIGFLNSTTAPAILIENCFIDNKKDMEVFTKGLQDISRAIVKAITGKSVPTVTKPETEKNNSSSKTLYKVQTGAFSDKKNAEGLAKDLKKKGYSVHIVKQ